MHESIHPFQSKVEDWHWWYRTRREILDGLLEGLALDPERARLLDIGCGTGGASVVLSRYGQAVGLDASPRSFLLSPERPWSFRVVGRAEVLPFADEAFDVVCALDVLEHLDDDLGCAREIHRVLKPGGTAVVFVPAFSFLWGHNDDIAYHKRRYTSALLRRTLEAAGLTVGPIGYFNTVLFLPLLAARVAERFLPSAMQSLEYAESPTVLNELLASAFGLEVPILRHTPLPFGASAYCLARRP